ncbi:MAG: uracil-DNA glycosylase family protein [Betaproteobacteria bacterium]|jgi:uracil-DNA glycosylase|nr:uracil-DNA glycosylase family protein [Betaproteobacteria bacterium]
MSGASVHALRRHQQALARCRRCPQMQGAPVLGAPAASPVMLIGQAPGVKELVIHKPFAWTAGKTLFGWFAGIGLDEEALRSCVYMAAVCRCFPGKLPRGGDRVPNREEIANCAPWLEAELTLLAPELVIPVGKLAIASFFHAEKLEHVVGKRHRVTRAGRTFDVVPLPHPSGASTWHRTEPGRTLLGRALAVIARHPAWRRIVREATPRR